MDIDKQNEKFDALEGLYPGQVDYLILNNRVATTRARLDVSQAVDVAGLSGFDSDFSQTSDNRLTFGGRIITPIPLFDEHDQIVQEAWQAAAQIANEREWDEEVEGMLVNIHPDEDDEKEGFSFFQN